MSDWWSRKLANTPNTQPATTQNRATPPVVQPAPMTHTPSGNALPQSAMNASRCPNCSSGNYGKSTPEARARCYDCGYPIQQSGSGAPGVRVPTEGPTQAAKQVSTANNFNPNIIIGKIGE